MSRSVFLLLCLPAMAYAFSGMPCNMNSFKGTGRVLQRSVVTCQLPAGEGLRRPLASKGDIKGLPALRMKSNDEDDGPGSYGSDMNLVPVRQREYPQSHALEPSMYMLMFGRETWILHGFVSVDSCLNGVHLHPQIYISEHPSRVPH
jgi:hypothetical protein